MDTNVVEDIIYPLPIELLPHRFPILQIDRIVEYVPGRFLEATREISADNPHFKGHFDGYPLLPGVILIEMMFQACGLYSRMESKMSGQLSNGNLGKAIKINNAVFKKEVRPGTLLTIRADFGQRVFKFSTFNVCIKNTEGEIVSSAELVVTI